MKYKIEFWNPGIKYTPKYANKLESAISQAYSKKWFGENGGDCWDNGPRKVYISERVQDDQWELIATITRDDITFVPCNERASVKLAMRAIQRLKSEIKKAAETALYLRSRAEIIRG